MKKTDITILTHLRADGRTPLTELSRKTSLPVSTIHDRLKKNVESKLIQPSALLNFDKLGFTTRASILLAVDAAEKEKLFAHLKEHPHVNTLFRINNGWNVAMECIFKNMQSLENFVEHLEGNFHLKQKEVHYILEELKREGFLAQPEHAEQMLSTQP